jgi:hypothetical protein
MWVVKVSNTENLCERVAMPVRQPCLTVSPPLREPLVAALGARDSRGGRRSTRHPTRSDADSRGGWGE